MHISLSALKPRRLDLYVLQEVIGPFLGGIIFFSFVFLMFQVLRLADFFIVHGVSGVVLGQMTALMILSFLPIALPIAFLIGILVAFGRLSADSELVAMKANGISLVRLSLPVLMLSLVVVAVSLGLNMEWVPAGDQMFKRTLIRVANTKVVSSIREGTFTSGFFDLLLYTDKLDAKTNRLSKVFIFDERQPKNPLTIVAKEGQLVPVKSPTDLGSAVVMNLFHGNLHSNDIEVNTYQKGDFEQYTLYLKIEEGEDTATIKPRMISYEELLAAVDSAPAGSSAYREYATEFWRRYAVALSPLVFVFLGIGFGSSHTRSVRAGAFMIAMVVILFYWAFLAFGTVLSQKGILPPFVGMQLGNFVMLVFAIRGFRSAIW